MLVTMFEILFWVSLGAILYAYLGYPICLICCHFFIRKQSSNWVGTYEPTVSIVLAAHNEANHIAGKLNNCSQLDYPSDKLEVLVGSDGSDDSTCEIAHQYVGDPIRLFEFEQRRGKMATVNRLVTAARGEICVFSDISELFDADAVRMLVRHFADPGIGAVTGNHIYNRGKSGLNQGTRFYWKYQRFLQQIESRIHTVCACDGTIYACRRSLFPYPPDHTINDDVAVPLGIITQRYRVVFEPSAIARGNMITETSRFFRQKIRSQAGKYQNFRQFGRMFIPWPLTQWWIFVSHSALPVFVPWLLIILLATSLVLSASGSSLFQLLLSGQIVFYLLSLLGYVGQRRGTSIPISAVPFYFVTANLGSLCGFLAYVKGTQKATWRRVD